jgi:thymidylate synthase (FAD)
MIEVTYVNHMGNDMTVVNAARVSFAKESTWDDYNSETEQYVLKDKDRKLVHYLAEHGHKSPFNHAFATFHVKAPIFVARQLQKHEYMPWNEISRRYVDSDPEFYVPDSWRGRSEDKKQGSAGRVEVGKIGDISLTSKVLYNSLLDRGVCPEQARMVLPQSMMTEWYWSGSLYAFAKMCNLRCAGDAQLETKLVANQICNSMKELFPVSWFALRLEK